MLKMSPYAWCFFSFVVIFGQLVLFPVGKLIGSTTWTTSQYSLTLSSVDPQDAEVSSRWCATLDTGKGSLEFELTIDFEGRHPIRATIRNGIELIDVEVKWNESTPDSIVFNFAHYDSKIEATLASDRDRMVGIWTKRRNDDEIATMPFAARLVENGNERELNECRESVDLPTGFVGRWEVWFDGDDQMAVADFKLLEGTNQVVGTFLTTTGDFRYLVGYVVDDQLKLSCFDGAHAFLFFAQLLEDGSCRGKFLSGNWFEQSWTGKKNSLARLPDPTQLTLAVSDFDWSELKFHGLDGSLVSLGQLTENRPAIIEVFGTWCPNCHDAAIYLQELQERHDGKDLAVVGLAFEVTSDFERNVEQVQRYVSRYEIGYPILVAGPADKREASDQLKFLDRVRSYPTFIFIDRSGTIVRVFQGFSGPAAGEDHQALRQTFESILSELIDD